MVSAKNAAGDASCGIDGGRCPSHTNLYEFLQSIAMDSIARIPGYIDRIDDVGDFYAVYCDGVFVESILG